MALNNPYALQFDGVNDNVSIPHIANYIFQSVTVELVCKRFNSGTEVNFLFSKGFESFDIHLGGTSNSITWIPTTGVGLNTPAETIVPNISHHISCVYDPGNSFQGIYVDGILKAYSSPTAAIANNTSAFFLGSRNAPVKYYYNGQVDEVRIWNRVLTQEEIVLYYNKKLRGNEDGLVAYYRLDEGYQNIAHDSTANQNRATIYGASWVPGIVDLQLGYIAVSTISPADVGYSSLTLKGDLRGLGDYPQAECYFQYAEDPTFQTGIIETIHQVLSAPGEFSQQITGLDNSKTYYYRAVAAGINL